MTLVKRPRSDRRKRKEGGGREVERGVERWREREGEGGHRERERVSK